jgi:hypothetical protein
MVSRLALLSSKIKRSVKAISARIALQQKIIYGSKTGSLLTDQSVAHLR